MKKLLLGVVVTGIAGLVACSEDEPKINPIVGLWELDDITISDAPANYSNVEGKYNSIYGEDAYVIEFYKDFAYDREINNIPGFGDLGDEGVWEILGDELNLDSDDDEIGGVDYSFTLTEEISDRSLTMEANSTTFGFTDDIYANYNLWGGGTGTCGCDLDTITTTASYDWFIDNYLHEVSVKATYQFDRVE